MVSSLYKTSNIDDIIGKLAFIPQIVGVFPYSWIGGEFVFVWWRVLYCLFVIFIMIAFIVSRFVFEDIVNDFDSLFEWQIAMLKFCISSGSIVGSIISAFFISKHLSLWMSAFRKAVVTLRVVGLQEYRLSIRSQLINIFIIGVLVLIDLKIYDSVHYLKTCWGYYLNSIITVVLVEQFTGSLGLLEQGFCQVRKTLDQTSWRHLENGVICYDSLTTAAEEVNNIYGLHLLFIMGSSFILITTNAFLVINDDEIPKKLLFLCWGIISIVPPWRLVEACHKIIERREEFNHYLNRHLIEEKDQGILENVKVNLHISMKRPLRFTAVGFFTLDFSLINYMAGASTTYLVILLQFDRSH